METSVRTCSGLVFEKHSKTLLIYRVIWIQYKNYSLYKLYTAIYFNACIPSNGYKIYQMHYFCISEPTFIPDVVVLGVVPDWSKQNDVTILFTSSQKIQLKGHNSNNKRFPTGYNTNENEYLLDLLCSRVFYRFVLKPCTDYNQLRRYFRRRFLTCIINIDSGRV